MSTNKAEVEHIIKPYLPTIYQAISQGIQDYQSDVLRLFFSPRTRSTVINDLITKNILTNLANFKGIYIKQKYGCTYVIIRDQIVLRFKKLNRDLGTNNIQTRRAKDFLNQRPVQLSLEMPDMPAPATNIFAGYIWDENQGNISGVYITCPNGNKNLWSLELLPQQVTLAEVIPIHSKGPRKTPTPRRRKESEKDSDQKQ